MKKKLLQLKKDKYLTDHKLPLGKTSIHYKNFYGTPLGYWTYDI